VAVDSVISCLHLDAFVLLANGTGHTLDVGTVDVTGCKYHNANSSGDPTADAFSAANDQ